MSQSKPREFTFCFVKEPQGFNVIWDIAKCKDVYPIEDFKHIHVIEHSAYLEAIARAEAAERELAAKPLSTLKQEMRYLRELEQSFGKLAKDSSDLRIQLDSLQEQLAAVTRERDELRAKFAFANDRRIADGICTRCNHRKHAGPTHRCPDGKTEHWDAIVCYGPDIDGDAEPYLEVKTPAP